MLVSIAMARGKGHENVLLSKNLRGVFGNSKPSLPSFLIKKEPKAQVVT